MKPIGILAGGGRLPLAIAESISARGGSLHIVGLEGEADSGIARFPHTWVNWGQIGRMITTLERAEARELVIAGGVKRPDLLRIRPDLGFFRNLPIILRLLAGGDDAVLTRVVRFFESHGLEVRGVHEVAPDLLASEGQIGGPSPVDSNLADARLGFAVRRALGPVDAGQAVIVRRREVVAIEGAEGTDAMLKRVAAMAMSNDPGHPVGVLAKGPKPGQELRVDMPAIGPRTVEQSAAAGLAGVAVEAGGVLILDRTETASAADARACSIFALVPEAVQPTERAQSAPRAGRVLGRACPSAADALDIAAGLCAVENLAPLATGEGTVVIRRYIRAIQAAEAPIAMLERTMALRRQWGLRWRKAGVFVRRAADGDDISLIKSLLAQVSRLELAGMAVTGPPEALAAYEDAARVADGFGLFLVVCEPQ